ncbi:MAG: hypothetical protein LUE27_05495 [Clostridia bacterium]|nr:hypothetical protein [Clostridia bacterium]
MKTKEEMLARQTEIVNAAKHDDRDLTDDEKREFEELQTKIDALPDTEETGKRSTSPAPGISADEASAQAQRAVEAERKRVSEISSICRDFALNADTYIKGGNTVDEVRAAALEHVRQHGAPIPAHADIVDDEQDKFQRAAVDSLLMRSGMTVDKPADGATEMMGMGLRDMAIECLSRDGETGLNRKSSDDIYTLLMQRQYFNPTAAFPAILDNAIEKAYVEGHENVPVTFDQWTKKGSLKDFKLHDNNYLAGPAGEFLEVPEGGELKHDLPKDEKLPQRRLKTYGLQFTLSRQAFVNDDIDLVTRIPARYAASARKTINKQCYEILVSNPAIYDGTELFSGDHANILASGTGITKDAMQRMIMALSTQKDQFGEAIIVRPATIIVPAGYMFDMYTLFFSPTIETTDNTQSVNPLYQWRNSIQVVEDPTINVLCGGFGNVMPWFLLGDKGDTDFIEVDYLNGQEIPTIRRMETPGTLGFVWDIYLDWGVSVMDYRGAIKNPGIEIASPLDDATN